MNRRNMLTSGMLLAGGVAFSGIPQKAFANRPLPPPVPVPRFNSALFSAFSTSLRNAVVSAEGTGATVTQLNTLATTFAISVQEMQNIGAVASFQSSLTSQADTINAYDPFSANVAALLANAQRLAPFQYAHVQQAVQQIDSAAKTELLAGNGLMTALTGLETALQNLTASVASTGGKVQISTSGRRGSPHIQDVYCMVPSKYVIAAFALSAIFAPEVEIGAILGATIYYGDVFSAGAALFGAFGTPGC